MGKGLIHLWEQLSFWQRLCVECPLAIAVMILVEFLFSGLSGNFVTAALQGTVLGVAFTVLDHAVLTRRRTGRSGGRAP